MIASANCFPSGRASQGTAAALSQFGNAAKAQALASSPANRRLRKAAAEFESLLLSSLWKSMKTSLVGPDEESDDPGHDTFEGLGIEAISSAVAKAGG